MTHNLIKLEQLALGRELKLLGRIESGVADESEVREYKHLESKRKHCLECQHYQTHISYQAIRYANDGGII